MIEVRVFRNKEAWLDGITEDFIKGMVSIPDSRQPRLCLAGGTTPGPVYEIFARLMVEGRVGLGPFLLVPGDERVAVQKPSDLNETMVRRAFAPALDSGVAILHSWFAQETDEKTVEDGVGTPSGSSPVSSTGVTRAADPALSMIQTMETRLVQLATAGQPLFDICYLGMGADGHTAGLFPDMPGLDDSGLCVRGLAPTPPRQRVSLGFSSLVSSGRTRFLISAAGKEAALDRLRAGDPACPAVMAATSDTVAFVLA